TTIAFNDFGIGLSGAAARADLKNTIVTGDNVDCTRIGGALTTQPTSTASFDQDGSCNLTLPSADPLLGPIDFNGGSTNSFVPQPGSPAINGGDNPSCLDIDPRYPSRPHTATPPHARRGPGAPPAAAPPRGRARPRGTRAGGAAAPRGAGPRAGGGPPKTAGGPPGGAAPRAGPPPSARAPPPAAPGPPPGGATP